MSDPVAAVTEAEASGEIAAIFADIRAVYRVGVVNLVWRHLATIPGALPWVWATVRPAYVGGAVARGAAGFRAGMVLPPVPALPGCLPEAIGLDAAARQGIGAVLAGYDRTNAMALVALSAVLRRVDGVAADGALPDRAGAADSASVALPRLLTLEEMAPATAELVRRLNLLGAEGDAPILASMYRHLAYWPAYLGLAWAQIAPLHADGRLSAAIAEAAARGRAQAGAVAAATAELAWPEGADRGAVRAAVARFTEGPIGRMVVICAMLRQAWPG